MISEEALEEFKVLYKIHFGEDISDQAALDKGTRLIRLVEIISKHVAKEELLGLESSRSKS